METRGLMKDSMFSFKLSNSVTGQVCVHSISGLPFWSFIKWIRDFRLISRWVAKAFKVAWWCLVCWLREVLSVNFVIWQMSLTLQIKYVGRNYLSHFVKRCVKNEPAKSVTIFSCFLCYSCFSQYSHSKHFQLYCSIYPLLFSFSF